MITKTIELQIEDYLERLNEASKSQENFVIESRFPIGSVCGINLELHSGNGSASVWASAVPEETPLRIRSIRVRGTCGNLTIDESKNDTVNTVDVGSIEELMESMATSGNHKLDLQLTFTLMAEMEVEDTQWIIPR